MNKVQEYRNYIIEHINYVKLAFKNYGELICNELDLDLQEMANQVDDHDESKWSDEEFDLYMRKFFPESKESKISDQEFNIAWLHHIHYNPHHPEHWIYYDEEKNHVTVYNIPDKYVAEMLFDWIAMSYKFNNKVYNWYNNEGKNKLFTDSTRFKVEYLLDKIKEFDDSDKRNVTSVIFYK